MLRSEDGLLCGSLNNDKVKLDVRSGWPWYLPDSSSMKNVELHLDGWMLAGCKCIVMKYCQMNKEKVRALRSVLAIHTYYVVERIVVTYFHENIKPN